MAHTKRAAKRKGGGIGDTDLVTDVERAEEDLEEDAEEDGIKIEAFNLKEERERGYFDEHGNYIEKTKSKGGYSEEDEDEEEMEDDAWVHSEEAKAIDPATLKKIQERQKKMMENEKTRAQVLTAVQIARLQWQIAKILDPGETVVRALKRLGGGRAGNRRHITKRAKHDPHHADQETPADKEKFNQLTEAASALLDAGEMEVYTRDKSYFQRAAAVYIDDDDDDDDMGIDLNGTGSGHGGQKAEKSSNFLSHGLAASVYDDVNEADDMFADEEQNCDGDEHVTMARDLVAGVGTALPKKTDTDVGEKIEYASWSIKDLRKYLIDNNVDVSSIVEKSELVEKAKTAAISISSSKTNDDTNVAKMQAPYGYSFDPGSGLWKSEETGMFWDQSSGAFFNSSDQKWYTYDGDKGWVLI